MLLQKNKSEIIAELIQLASLDRDKLKESADNTAKGATSFEAKQEGKYDTRALLDSYLAGAQDARLRELDAQIDLMQRFQSSDFAADEAIAVGAIVQLKSNTSSHWYYLLPSLGGYKIEMGSELIQTITVNTPIGESLVGLYEGDDFEGPLGKGLIQKVL